jgi:hypothetical protein
VKRLKYALHIYWVCFTNISTYRPHLYHVINKRSLNKSKDCQMYKNSTGRRTVT